MRPAPGVARITTHRGEIRGHSRGKIALDKRERWRGTVARVTETNCCFPQPRPLRPLLHTQKKQTSSSPSCPAPRLPAAPLPAPRRRPAVRDRTLQAPTGLQRAFEKGGRTPERSNVIITTTVVVAVLVRVVAARLALPVAPRDARLVRCRARDAAGPRRRRRGRGRGPACAGLGRVFEVGLLPCQ